MEIECSSCREDIEYPICNQCRTRKMSFILERIGADVNDITHIVNSIKRYIGNEWEGEVLCVECSENIVAICNDCYLSKVKNVLYFYFPKKFANRLFHILENKKN